MNETSVVGETNAIKEYVETIIKKQFINKQFYNKKKRTKRKS